MRESAAAGAVGLNAHFREVQAIASPASQVGTLASYLSTRLRDTQRLVHFLQSKGLHVYSTLSASLSSNKGLSRGAGL